MSHEVGPGMKMEMKNLTPHTISIYRVVNGEWVPAADFPPSGTVARLDIRYTALDSLDVPLHDGAGEDSATIPVYTTEQGECINLPMPRDGMILLVSMAIRTAFPERTDLASPGQLIRDDEGRPQGCMGLIVNHGEIREVASVEQS